jgi:hypothetical protein
MSPFLVVADAAEAAGRVFGLVLIVAATAWVFVTFRRRRERGERATGWLVALVVLGLLCVGALANAAESSG